jgi:hypothetical protein
MQIRFNVQVVREPAGARRRRGRTFAVVVLAALAVFVPVAFAADTFTDVPPTHPFHDQIERTYAAGMIGACAGSPPPPNQTFCPGNTITKGSAANQYDKAFGLDGTPRPFTPTWRKVNIVTGGSTPPFSVDSAQRVTNLNADLLDGASADAIGSTATAQQDTGAAAGSATTSTVVNQVDVVAPTSGFLVISGNVYVANQVEASVSFVVDPQLDGADVDATGWAAQASTGPAHSGSHSVTLSYVVTRPVSAGMHHLTQAVGPIPTGSAFSYNANEFTALFVPRGSVS